MRLVLLSNSVAPGQGFLEHALDAISDAIGGGHRLLFLAFASFDPERYTQVMHGSLRQIGIEVVPANQHANLTLELDRADAVFVGGGNVFRLLKTLQDAELVDVIRERVREGLPFLGASAGANLACPTVRTTNDMPIVEPRSLSALGLVPFQINPHYVDLSEARFAETRDKRIGEFLHENDVPVVGLREGAWLDVRDSSMTLGGSTGGRLFERGRQPREIELGSDLSELLEVTPRYDHPASD